MRISDWSSDVCSSDLTLTPAQRAQLVAAGIPGCGDFRTIQLFGTAFDSRTQGVDAVLTYGFDMIGGKATLSAKANYTKNQVTRAGPLIAGDRERLLELEEIGRAHVRTPVTNVHPGFRLM